VRCLGAEGLRVSVEAFCFGKVDLDALLRDLTLSLEIRSRTHSLARTRQDSLGLARIRQDSLGFARTRQDSLGFARTRVLSVYSRTQQKRGEGLNHCVTKG
jgi:hypothetical protein